MTRPTLEVADILRAQGDRFLERYRSSFGFQQLKAFRAILRCRTAALGGHRDACLRCGYGINDKNTIVGAYQAKFGNWSGYKATYEVVSASEITTAEPAGATTTGTVEVTTPKGTLKSNVVFRVTK
jgi:Transposase zinc-binding domain